MTNKVKIEVCCGTVDDCVIAQNCGADRIELNSSLELGGMTPSVGSLLLAKKLVSLPIVCMVRPRPFGFNYTELQYQTMLIDAKNLIDNGADGIVFGFLHEDGTINIPRTKEMVALIKPKEAIFHKAFDSTPDLEVAIKQLIECGVDRILTIGGACDSNLLDGCNKLGALNQKYGQQIEILPGGGVRTSNVIDILNASQSNQIHMTAKHAILDNSTMHYGTNNQSIANHSYFGTEESQLKTIIDIINTN